MNADDDIIAAAMRNRLKDNPITCYYCLHYQFADSLQWCKHWAYRPNIPPNEMYRCRDFSPGRWRTKQDAQRHFIGLPP